MSPFILENPVYEINYIILPLIFLIGAISGSFSHAFADGFINEKTLLRRSQCNSCKEIIFWYHLIPVMSFLSLKGKCFFCNTKIKLELFLFELLFGLLFVAYFLFFFDFQAIKFSLFSIFLGIIFQTDRKKLIIHLPSLILLLVVSFSSSFLETQSYKALIEFALLFIFGWFIIFIISYSYFLVRGIQGFGSGDKWLLGTISTIHSFHDVLFIFLFSSLLASCFGIAFIVKNKKISNIKIPFGSFLCFVSIFYVFI